MRSFHVAFLIWISLSGTVRASDQVISPTEFDISRKVELLGKENSDWNSSTNCALLKGTRPVPAMPWRNQGRRGWCFADAAADLATVACGRFISAADIGLRYEKQVDNGGDILSALRKSQKNGFCSEELLPEGNFSNMPQKEYVDAVAAIENAAEQHFASCSAIEATSKIFGLMADVASILKSAGKLDVMQRLADEKCRPRIRDCKTFGGGGPFYGSVPRQKQAMAITMEELRRGQPVSVSLDIISLLAPKVRDTAIESQKQLNPSSPAFAGHALTAVGLEFNAVSGKCEFKLRNSWGGSCSEDFDPKKVRCDQENLWVPADSVFGALNSIAFISEPGVNDKNQFKLDPYLVIPDTPE